jgi:hypothetical protein|tara:strand:- start:708 stop:1466 length:759 start_codon:yes stop_codon:yes gene_type:complete
MAFLKYEDVLLKVAGESIFAQQASINVSTSLEPVRLIDGSIHRYAASNGARGTLSFSHYLTGSIASFLDVTGVAETSTNGSFGGLTFDNAYLKSMQFQVQPYAPILVESSFDFYGSFSNSISASHDVELAKDKYSHAIKSFVAGTPSNMNHTLSFSYAVNAARTPVYLAGETVPTRVTKEATNIQMTVQGDNIGTNINHGGAEANLRCSIFDINDSTALQNFHCSGRISQQELNVDQQGYLVGQISVIEADQ